MLSVQYLSVDIIAAICESSGTITITAIPCDVFVKGVYAYSVHDAISCVC